MTSIDLELSFYVKFCFVFVNSSSKFAYLLIWATAIMSILLVRVICKDDIYNVCVHMYKPEVCTELLNILRLGTFNSFGLLKSI